MRSTMLYAFAAISAILLLSVACGDSSNEREPTDAEVHFKRGFDYAKFGFHRKAIQEYDKAIELTPSDADAYYNRGHAYGELGEYRRAIEDYDKAIELAPADVDAYNIRGIAYGELAPIHRKDECGGVLRG